MKKKIKLDGSSASDVEQEEDGSEEGVKDPPANEIAVNEGSLNKPRNKADTDRSSGSVPVSIDDEDSQTKKMGSSYSSSASRSSEGSITEKRDSASLTNEEERKKMKLHDISSSSGSDSNAKQGDGSEEAASTSLPTANVMDDNLSPILTEDKPRNQDDKDFPSGSVPASTHDHDHDSQTRKTGSSSSPITESASCSSKNERILVYQKTLTRDDVFYCRLMIPLESGIEFLPEPEKYDGRYDLVEISVMDHDKQMWEMEASFDELSSSYMFWSNWDKYVKKYELKPEDVIFFYEDPTIEHCFFIEYEKRKRDSNPKGTT